MTTAQSALELYDQGIPVAIEDPILKMYLEGHRHGYHHKAELTASHCPACARELTK
jgi:hypothetical protein